MENTKNVLPDHNRHFFKDLSEYLDTKLYFFGSVQRPDYFPGKSDIDVDIFTDNEHSTMTKLQHYLKISNTKYKKVVWKLKYSDKLVYGHKIMYDNVDNNITSEFSIYDDKYKNDILSDHLGKSVLPIHASILLIILKKLYYDFKLISDDNDRYLKGKILTFGIGVPEDQYVILDSKNILK